MFSFGDFVVAALLAIFLLGPVVIYIIYKLWYEPNHAASSGYVYNKKYSESANRMMQAVCNGEIKQHILWDDTAKETDPNKQLKKYNNFLKTDTFKKIGQLK